MKHFVTLLVALLLTGVVTNSFAADKPPKAKSLQHFVALKFKESANKEQVEKVLLAFRDLERKIVEVEKLRWGTNVSPEKLNKGFTHAFKLTFKTEKDRDLYLEHPEHKAFANLLKPVLEDVFVFDYWSME